MSRIVLLVMVMVWMGRSSASPGERLEPLFGPAGGPLVLLAGYAVMVAAMGLWSRLLIGRVGDERSSRNLLRFNRAIYICRLLVPAWLAVGVYRLGWDRFVADCFSGLETWPWKDTHLELPQALLGTAPALLAWVGLIWANYPTDRALREQSVFLDLDDDLPIRQPPGLIQTIGAALRLQVMFTLVPVLLILIVRDLTTIGIWALGRPNPQGQENWVIVPATVAIFILAPELLRRVLRTEPLPEGPLRQKLDQMCRDAGLKYRQILLWHTDGTMGNAAVMGIFARVRYVLLSDLLLETMTDTQIEAVFAHELGHVVHKHMLWYGVFALMIMGFVAGPGDILLTQLHDWLVGLAGGHYSLGADQQWRELQGLIAVGISMGSFLLAFGYLSPRFERQADVFAARTMQRIAVADARALEARRWAVIEAAAAAQADPMPSELIGAACSLPGKSYVGEYGAGVFTSALHRVATINCIPVSARNWSHGSIAQRMRYLQEISSDPAHTHRFDRVMVRLYATLLVALGTFGVWGAMHSVSGSMDSSRGGVRVVNPGTSSGAALGGK